jgi:hypothetical protein
MLNHVIRAVKYRASPRSSYAVDPRVTAKVTRKKAGIHDSGLVDHEMVAGVRFELTTFGLCDLTQLTIPVAVQLGLWPNPSRRTMSLIFLIRWNWILESSGRLKQSLRTPHHRQVGRYSGTV